MTVGVTKIELWIRRPNVLIATLAKTCNNATICTYQGGPYNAGNLQYYAFAFDAAGNKGVFPTVTVPILVAVP